MENESCSLNWQVIKHALLLVPIAPLIDFNYAFLFHLEIMCLLEVTPQDD